MGGTQSDQSWAKLNRSELGERHPAYLKMCTLQTKKRTAEAVDDQSGRLHSISEGGCMYPRDEKLHKIAGVTKCIAVTLRAS